MTQRTERLRRLLRVQNKLTAMHEMRRAGLLNQANAADAEAAEIAARKDDAGSLSGLFPDLYERGITRAMEKRDGFVEAAAAEAGKIARENVRKDRIEQDFHASRRIDDRKAEEVSGLEAVERLISPRKA
ncbi:hypothetical protein [Aquibium oceanicum]|uniref:Uncharacterized protein n=1 Tax=Aquibium oceanicum TaxID=1670800 RepID=A0A1L3SWA1_9HYPH|nr:hypothetical protein [Aquibium oceanicum]APH73650.1 hypothetical protein BSQ44_21400 [Aquibium oceanicum]